MSMESAKPPEGADRMSVIRHWTIYVCPLCGSDEYDSTENDSLCRECGEWMNVEPVEVEPSTTTQGAVDECETLKRRLVTEMCLTRTRTEMLEDFGPDYAQPPESTDRMTVIEHWWCRECGAFDGTIDCGNCRACSWRTGNSVQVEFLVTATTHRAAVSERDELRRDLEDAGRGFDALSRQLVGAVEIIRVLVAANDTHDGAIGEVRTAIGDDRADQLRAILTGQ